MKWLVVPESSAFSERLFSDTSCAFLFYPECEHIEEISRDLGYEVIFERSLSQDSSWPFNASCKPSLVWHQCEGGSEGPIRGSEVLTYMSGLIWSSHTHELMMTCTLGLGASIRCYMTIRCSRLVHSGFAGSQKDGSQKGGMGGFGGCSLDDPNWNEGTKNGTTVPKTGTRVPKTGTTVPKTGTRARSPKPPFYRTTLLFPLDSSDMYLT